MRLRDLCSALTPVLVCADGDDCELSACANNSGAVKPGTIFCAIKGSKADGHKYIQNAIEKGASAVCVSADWQGTVSVPVLRVSDSYFAWGILCEEFAGRPADSFRVHTVTGTNGKTTIAFILHHLLETAGRKPGLISTVLCDTGDGHATESLSTMPDAAKLQQIFSDMKGNCVTDAVTESSSHGLHQHRAGNLKYASAIFTNLTGDHLDYHKTMENYYQAKKSLFTSMLAPDAPAVIHTLGDYGKRLYRELTCRKLEFSMEDPGAFCYLKQFTPVNDGSLLDFQLDGNVCHWHSPLCGEHNAANLLEAVTAMYALGMELPLLQAGAESAPPAPGRLEPVALLSGATAFVDYAHTDDALFRVLTALRKIVKPGGKIITVFGCGGDRDRTKRPRMGKVAAELSDYAIVTSDNPRTERPGDIIAEIVKGIPDGCRYEVAEDRAEAIAKAVTLAGANDILLVAGKGHEPYQEINGVRHHFDDREQLSSRSLPPHDHSHFKVMH